MVRIVRRSVHEAFDVEGGTVMRTVPFMIAAVACCVFSDPVNAAAIETRGGRNGGDIGRSNRNL